MKNNIIYEVVLISEFVLGSIMGIMGIVETPAGFFEIGIIFMMHALIFNYLIDNKNCNNYILAWGIIGAFIFFRTKNFNYYDSRFAIMGSVMMAQVFLHYIFNRNKNEEISL